MTAADGPGRFFGPTERAVFLSRPNRFTLACRLGGKPVRTFAPNPGRMQELLLPGATVFIVHASGVEYFLPEYHTDPAFSAALARARGRIDIIPLGLTWDEDLSLRPEARLLTIPWEILAKEDEDRGCYLLVLEVPVSCSLAVGSLGAIRLPKGFYVYTGSARGGLAARIARHRRRGAKRLRWHVDHLRPAAELRVAYPIRASEDLECDLARAVRELAETAGGWDVPRFGSSDCGCSSHLFGFGRNPVLTRRFVDLLLRARIDRLIPGP